ncbi:MAG TPA: FHA domain-containing protein [Gammaproteobacteria bacterium]|nr:FHA domain-containing protein [Gammaproteobacteria bacterium]
MAELIQYANGVPGIRFSIDKPVIRIGRSEIHNDICVVDAYVSKEHALLEARPHDGLSGRCDFYLHDLGSTNKTYVNKKPVTCQRLKNNDMVYLGRNMFRFVCSEHEVMDFPETHNTSSNTLELVTGGNKRPLDSAADSGLRSGFSRRLRILGAESLLD